MVCLSQLTEKKHSWRKSGLPQNEFLFSNELHDWRGQVLLIRFASYYSHRLYVWQMCQGLLPSILLKGLSYTERPKRRMVRHKNHTARKPPQKRESLHLVWGEQCTLPSSSTWVLQPSRCGIHRVRAILHPWRSTTRQGGSRKQRVSREDGVRLLPGRNLHGYRTLYNCGLLVVVVIVAFK